DSPPPPSARIARADVSSMPENIKEAFARERQGAQEVREAVIEEARSENAKAMEEAVRKVLREVQDRIPSDIQDQFGISKEQKISMRSVSTITNRFRSSPIPLERGGHFGVWNMSGGSSIDLDWVSETAGWTGRQLESCEVSSFLVQLAIASWSTPGSRLGLLADVARVQIG
ncbi:unnamed protein product, partial [Prorocentrum cordatum]